MIPAPFSPITKDSSQSKSGLNHHLATAPPIKDDTLRYDGPFMAHSSLSSNSTTYTGETNMETITGTAVPDKKPNAPTNTTTTETPALKNFVPLVYSMDQNQISRYHYLVLQQLVLCKAGGYSTNTTTSSSKKGNVSSTETTSSNTSLNRVSGYGGVMCRHCAISVPDLRQARTFYSANPRKFKSSGFSHIVEHLMLCRHVPSEVTANMETLRLNRKVELRKFTLDERDRFWGKIWARIRYIDGLAFEKESFSWMYALLQDEGRTLQALDPIPMPTKQNAFSNDMSTSQLRSSDMSSKKRKASPDSTFSNTSSEESMMMNEYVGTSFDDSQKDHKEMQELSIVLSKPRASLPYPWLESDVVLTANFVPIIYPDDANCISPFHRLCMLSLTVCRYDISAKKHMGQNGGYKIGHGGVCCRHCNSRKFFSDRVASFRSSGMSHIIEHLFNCAMVPSDFKSQLEVERAKHKSYQRQIPQEAKNRFWDRIWTRLRSLDSLRLEKWMDDIQDGRIEQIKGKALDLQSRYVEGYVDSFKEPKSNGQCATTIHQAPPIKPYVPFTFLSDETSLSVFHFQCMKQLVLCKNEETASMGKNLSYPSGYGGIRCIHCAKNARKPRSFYSADLGTFRNSGLSHIIDHLLNCIHSSAMAKSKLLSAKASHKVELRKIPLDERNAFWDRIWRRIRAVDSFGQENWESEIMNIDLENLSSYEGLDQHDENIEQNFMIKPVITLDDGRLVQEEEMHLVPFYQFFALDQMRACKFGYTSKCSLKETKFPVGYGGMTCKFCSEHDDCFGNFYMTIEDLRSSVDEIFHHLIKCAHTPDVVKSILSEAYSKKNEHETMIFMGASLEFWSIIWRRMHCVDENEALHQQPNKRESDSNSPLTGKRQKPSASDDDTTAGKLLAVYDPTKAANLKQGRNMPLPLRGQLVSDYLLMISKKLASF